MNDGWRVEWFVLANRAQIPTWHPIYIHLKSAAEAEAKAKELKALVPAVKALAVQPATADYRIVGVLRVGDAHPLGVAVPPDHPGVTQWQSQRYASGERVWLSLPVGAYTNYNSIAEAEAALAAEKEGPAPRPQPETVEDFSKEKLTTGTVEPPAKPKPPQKTNNEKPPTTVPQANWQKPQPFSTKHAGPITGGKVVDLDAEKAKHELEEKVAALEKERDQWKEKAARTEPAQWRDNPGDLAAVRAKLDANAAIDFYEALEQKLKGTPEWRAYLDERLEEHLNAARRIREQYAAEDKAALNADPKERGIARIKNALELALRVDTSEQEAIAAFAGARRLCEEGDLDFLARLTDLSRDPAPPERGIA